MIALPNNVTNLSRALYLLQHEGLITLKAGHERSGADLATVHDIATNPRRSRSWRSRRRSCHAPSTTWIWR